MLPMHDLVIYHGGCIDGFTSAWVAWRELGTEAEYFPAFYPVGGELTKLPDVTGRDVLMLDFCVSRARSAMPNRSRCSTITSRTGTCAATWSSAFSTWSSRGRA